MGFNSPTGRNPSVYFGPDKVIPPAAAPVGNLLSGGVTFADAGPIKKKTSVRKKSPKKNKLSDRIELDVYRSDLDRFFGDSPEVVTVGTRRYAIFHLHAIPNWTSEINISIANHRRQAIIEITSPKALYKPSSIAQTMIKPGTVIFESINDWKKCKLQHYEDSIKAEIILNLPFVAEMETSDDIHPGNSKFMYHDFDPPGCSDPTLLQPSQRKFLSVLFVFKEFEDNFRVSRKVEAESSFVVDDDEESF